MGLVVRIWFWKCNKVLFRRSIKDYFKNQGSYPFVKQKKGNEMRINKATLWILFTVMYCLLCHCLFARADEYAMATMAGVTDVGGAHGEHHL